MIKEFMEKWDKKGIKITFEIGMWDYGQWAVFISFKTSNNSSKLWGNNDTHVGIDYDDTIKSAISEADEILNALDD